MSGAILNLIKKKESIRQKLKLSPLSHLREKLKNLRKTVKRLLWNSRDKFLGSVESDLNTNPKRFLSVLKLNSKSHTISDRVSTHQFSPMTPLPPPPPPPHLEALPMYQPLLISVGINAHGWGSPTRVRSP